MYSGICIYIGYKVERLSGAWYRECQVHGAEAVVVHGREAVGYMVWNLSGYMVEG